MMIMSKSRSQQHLGYFDGHQHKEFRRAKSSAMSDTSEAPSLASHVRHLQMPTHQSELDQYLDDLFSPVLDANLDDAMSDARSLAQSIKGNDDHPPCSKHNGRDEDELEISLNLQSLCDNVKLAESIRGVISDVEVMFR